MELQALVARMVDAGMNAAVVEVSSHALALDRTAGCEFDVAIFTNLTQDHLDFHADMDGYFQAKLRLSPIWTRPAGSSGPSARSSISTMPAALACARPAACGVDLCDPETGRYPG